MNRTKGELILVGRVIYGVESLSIEITARSFIVKNKRSVERIILFSATKVSPGAKYIFSVLGKCIVY